MDRNYSIQTFFAGAGAAFSYAFGGWSLGFKWLLFFIVFDYITGMMAAYYSSELSSKIGFVGIMKKIMYLVFVAMAFGLSELTNQIGIRDGTIVGFCVNECLSIAENGAKMGVPIPKVLLQGIEIWKNLSGKENKNDRP